MPNSTKITAAVIGGGESKRFGEPKALALLGERPLIDYAIAIASQISQRIMINYGQTNHYRNKGISTVKDIIPNCGPLGGIYSVLVHARTPWVAILPCDMPLLSPKIYELLLGHRQPGHPLAACSERGIEPLVSLWPRNVVKELGTALKEQRFALHEVLRQLQVMPVSIPDTMPDYRPEFFFNINRKEDLQALQQKLPQL